MTRKRMGSVAVRFALALAAVGSVAAFSLWSGRAAAAAQSAGQGSGSIAAAVQASGGNLWLRYESDSPERLRGMCGGDSNGVREVDLDRAKRWQSNGNNDDASQRPGRIQVYLRTENRRVTGLEFFDVSCAVTASASEIRDLGAVPAAESVRYLESLMAEAKDSEKLGKRIVFATAFHATPRADAALLGWAGEAWPMKVRRDAAFWMGSARGESGFKSLVQLVRKPGDGEFRKHVVFAISLNKSEQGTTELLRVAKEGGEADVRRAAIFWLSQRAGKAAVDGIEDIVENEADAKLREHAVFALSQLPDAEGVPKLIQLAKTHRDPGVRKKAIFRLSQKDDPRVTGFLEDVLMGAARN